MTRFPHAGYLLTVANLVLLAASPATAHRVFRIVTHWGDVFTGCDIRIDQTYNVAVLDWPGSTRNIGFGDIAQIYDENGNDAADRYLKGSLSPDGDDTAPAGGADSAEFAPLGQDKNSGWNGSNQRTKPRLPKAYEATISGFSTYSIPIGSYYDGMPGGVGFGGEVSVAITPEYALRFSVVKQGISVDSLDFIRISRQVGIAVLEHDVSITMMRYVASLQYYGWPQWDRGGRLWWWASSGLGVINHKFSGNVVAIDPYTGQPGAYSMNDSQTKFIFTAALGVVPMLTRTVGLDCAFNWDLVIVGAADEETTSGSFGNGVQYASVIDLRVGLTMVFR